MIQRVSGATTRQELAVWRILASAERALKWPLGLSAFVLLLTSCKEISRWPAVQPLFSQSSATSLSGRGTSKAPFPTGEEKKQGEGKKEED